MRTNLYSVERLERELKELEKEAKSKRGRPTKLNPEVVTKLAAAFNMGFNDTEATAYAGVSRKTYYEWMSFKPDFRNKINRAKIEPTLKAKEVVINEVNKGSLNAAMWWLKHKAADEFTTAPQEKPEVPAEWQRHVGNIKSIIDTANKRIAYRYRNKLFGFREQERVKQAKNSKKYDKPSHYENILTRQIRLTDKELADEAELELTATNYDFADIRELLQDRHTYECDLRDTIDRINNNYDAN